MQDRTPIYPGRVKLAPVAGQENVYDMTREDSPTQPGTPLSKATFLKDATAALYGLGSTAVPDDAFAFLGKYNQHWWKRRTRVVTVQLGTQKLVNVSSQTSSSVSGKVPYSSDIVLDEENVTVSLAEPVNYTSSIGYSSPSGAQVLVGNYFKSISSGSNVGKQIYYCDSYSGISSSSGWYYIQVYARTVSAVVSLGEWEYLYSDSRNAYPDSGTADGYEYKYLGVPFDKAVNGIKIDGGSYTGTGTASASINLGVEPDFLIVVAKITTRSMVSEDPECKYVIIPQGGYMGSGNEGSDNAGTLLLSGSILELTADSSGYTKRSMNYGGREYFWYAITL